MPSGSSRISKRSSGGPVKARRKAHRPPASDSPAAPWLLLAALASLSAITGYWFWSGGYTLYYGDAEAHFNIARSVIDSKTPGPEQLGTVWLPLLHVLLIPFVRSNAGWQSGAAGVLPSLLAFTLAGLLLFLAARRALDSTAAGMAAAFTFALNPNMLYLAATPMTEPLFFACQMGLLLGLVWFAQSNSLWAVVLAGVAGAAGSLVRYDGWFLLPIAALVIFAVGGEQRWRASILFTVVTAPGPLSWLGHNRYYQSDWLDFYRGPYSPMAIQGGKPYPGLGNWMLAWKHYAQAAQLCVGIPLLVASALGLIAVLVRRAWIALPILLAPPLFYLLNLHSGASPIFVPGLWPNTYYNSRYGMAALPLAAFAAAGLVALFPKGLRGFAAAAVIALGVAPWLAYPRSNTWVVFQESVENSKARRAWTSQAAAFLRHEYKRGDGVLSSFGDLTGILRQAGVPLREVLHEGNGIQWDATRLRPDLHLRAKWIITFARGPLAESMRKAREKGMAVELVKAIAVEGAPTVEIYRYRSTPRVPSATGI